jgi:hypothetical protein
LLFPPSSTRLERCQSARLLGVLFGTIDVIARLSTSLMA